jgi:hypothetical protein
MNMPASGLSGNSSARRYSRNGQLSKSYSDSQGSACQLNCSCQIRLVGKSARNPLRSALKRTQPAANRTEPAAKRTIFPRPLRAGILCYNAGMECPRTGGRNMLRYSEIAHTKLFEKTNPICHNIFCQSVLTHTGRNWLPGCGLGLKMAGAVLGALVSWW